MTNLLAAMYSRPDGSDGRESRTIWVADESTMTVRLFVGWSCEPSNAGYWWVPDYGHSVSIGHGSSFTEAEATKWLVDRLAKKQREIEQALDRLRVRTG